MSLFFHQKFVSSEHKLKTAKSLLLSDCPVNCTTLLSSVAFCWSHWNMSDFDNDGLEEQGEWKSMYEAFLKENTNSKETRKRKL